jgi:UDP-glucose 4-epimerase
MLTHNLPQAAPPQRAVIMGANGFIGAAIRRRLDLLGVATHAISRDTVDLLAPGAAEKLAGHLRPGDFFVAVSALAPVKNAQMLSDNIKMIDAMANALKAQPVAHILNIGSDAVFADSADPLTENSCRAPGSLHGIMHLARETMLGEAAGQTPFATLRPTLVYGRDDPHNGYGPNRFRRLAKTGSDIVLFGAGEERRDHVWVEDVAQLAAAIVMRRSSGSLNAATGTVVSFRACAEEINSICGGKSRILETQRAGPMPHNGYRPFDPRETHRAFPDFRYMPPADGFRKASEE